MLIDDFGFVSVQSIRYDTGEWNEVAEARLTLEELAPFHRLRSLQLGLTRYKNVHFEMCTDLSGRRSNSVLSYMIQAPQNYAVLTRPNEQRAFVFSTSVRLSCDCI